MTTVKVFGAGSIGNHLTHACRTLGWQVTLCDVDSEALRRTREEIHPQRYGSWDPEIRLVHPDEVARENFDLVIVGTPPDHHIPIALAQLEQAAPRVLLVEKPLCPPDLKGCLELQQAAAAKDTFVAVGYNHGLTGNTIMAEAWLADHPIGDSITLRSMTREHWGGIFGAHPWLSGPADSYLGFSARGGGALGEHSHAIHIWQHFAGVLGQGRVKRVSAMLDMVDEAGARYDRIAQLSVVTESGLVGSIEQDVVTQPPRKWLRVDGSQGFLEWEVGGDHDLVRTSHEGGDVQETRIDKTRPDDFLPEVEHIAQILSGDVADSPISLERGLETMMVVAAAFKSHEERRWVEIDWKRGFVPEALV